MKLKALAATLAFALGLTAAALAAPPPGKGKKGGAAAVSTADSTATTTTTAGRGKGKGSAEHRALGCRPVVAVLLRGELVAAASGDSFAMLVEGGNKHARPLEGMQATVKTDARTKVTRRGKAKLADLVAGDRLVVHARACKARRSADGAAPAPAALELLAKKVVAKPAKAERPEGDDEDGTTTGTTGSTSTTGTTAP